MKNLILAVGALIVVVVVIFLISSRHKYSGDTLIPSPTPVESPKIVLQMPSSTESAKTVPFPVLSAADIQGKKIKISTPKGDIVIELLPEAPVASSNFIYLVNKHFYDGVTFHRIIKGFMIQGGDPRGDGTGGPGYAFADEPVSMDYKRGIAAMANAGPNTNGSQFFIMHQDYNLPHDYTIFGKVISGMDVVDTIANSQVDQNDKPIEKIVMNTLAELK